MGFYMIDNPNPNTPQGTLPRRGGAKLSGTCIVHTSESVLDRIGPDSTAEDCAAFIARRTDYGCYHTLVDSDSIIDMYPYEWETWQDSETNNWAVGISVAIRAAEWLSVEDYQRDRIYRNIAKAGANFVLYMRVQYGIEVPRRRISGDEARNRVPGFCAHGDSGLYRSDPGADFDWNLFFNYVNQALAGTLEDDDEMALSASFEGNVRASLESLHDKEDALVVKYNKFDSQVREALDIIRNEQAALRAVVIADNGLTKEELLEAIEKAVIKVNVSVGTENGSNPA